MEVIASLLLYFQVELAHLQRVTERVLCETRLMSFFFGANCHLSFREELSRGKLVFFSVSLLD